MVNCCSWPDCRSGCVGDDKTLSIFRAPKNPDDFKKWSSVLKNFDIDLQPNHFICEKHFLNENILREKVLRDPEGKVIFQKKFNRVRLRPGAVPFAFVPSLSATAENSVIPMPMDAATDEGACMANNITNNIAVMDTVAINEMEEKLIEIEYPESKTKRTLFDDTYNGIFKLKLPDLSWDIHMRLEPMKCITISQVEKFSDVDKVPTYVKRITLNEQLQLKLFVLHSKVAERTVANIEELQSTLEELCNVQLCKGGPVIGTLKNVQPHCDVIADRWRHNLCSLVTECSVICSKCRSLDKILRTHLDHKGKQKKLHIMMSPTRKKKLEILRKAHRVQMQAFKRNKRRIEAVKLEVKDLQNKLTETAVATFEESVNKLNLPHAQIMLIRECISVGKHALTKGRRYTSEWLLTCLLLQIRNPSTYNFLRENQILPLPYRNTTRRYLDMIDLKCGFDEKFFTAFRKKIQTLPERAKHGVLIFDEMQVRKSVTVSSKDLTLVGLVDDCTQHNHKSASDLADHALVFMFSSLSVNFYQPIANFASKSATAGKILAQLVIQAIIEVEKAGGFIDGIICDGASTNRKMWSEFGVCGDIDSPSHYFRNPYDVNRNIYVLSDAPHLIKCIRNRLYKQKTLKINGGVVDWNAYKNVYDQDYLNPGFLRVCPKLSRHHINPDNCLKMRVSLATQIFSNSVAAGLRFYRHKKVKKLEGSESTEEFTLKINDLFDALNRRFPAEGIQKGGKDLQVLQDSLEWLNSWERDMTNGSINPLQFLTSTTAQGLRVTILSTIALTNYLLDNCQFKYVLTAKANQDRLEQFFGIIRQAGCQNDHPTLPTFLQLYKLLSVYKLLKPPRFGNCTVHEDEHKPIISMDDIKSIFQNNDKKNLSYRSIHVEELKQKLNNIIDETDFECDDIIDIEHDYADSSIVDCIIYYITGFICRKMTKISTCETCKLYFKNEQSGSYSSTKEASLVNIETRGRLIHPHIVLFKMFQTLETIFQKHLNYGACNLYQVTVDEALVNCKFAFPCDSHKEEVIAFCLHYFVVMRMRQSTKIKSREIF